VARRGIGDCRALRRGAALDDRQAHQGLPAPVGLRICCHEDHRLAHAHTPGGAAALTSPMASWTGWCRITKSYLEQKGQNLGRSRRDSCRCPKKLDRIRLCSIRWMTRGVMERDVPDRTRHLGRRADGGMWGGATASRPDCVNRPVNMEARRGKTVSHVGKIYSVLHGCGF